MRLKLSLFLLTLPLATWAQDPLTEATAVRLGLARADLVDLERGAVQAAEADVVAAGVYPNPTLSYSRERIGGSPDAVDESFMLAQTLDLSGRRGLLREAASRRVDAASASNAKRQLDVAAEIRRSFSAALLGQEIIRATETWARRFAQVEGRVSKLARAGDASGYDRRRIERERLTAEAQLAAARAEQMGTLSRLTALTGQTGEPKLSGEPLPPPLPPAAAALARLDQRPDLKALIQRAEAAELAGRAAQRGGIPDVTVGIGIKRVDMGLIRESGPMVALSIPLPLFDRQQADFQRAAAEDLQARAEFGLTRNRALGELRGMHGQAEGLRLAAANYRRSALASSPELLRIAEAAYQGGESSLLELLDAYRGALEAETTALELEQRAREARIEYDLLTGSTE